MTLNDPQFVEAARFLAQTTLKEGGETDEARIDFLARRLLARPFRPEELKVVQGGWPTCWRTTRTSPRKRRS